MLIITVGWPADISICNSMVGCSGINSASNAGRKIVIVQGTAEH